MLTRFIALASSESAVYNCANTFMSDILLRWLICLPLFSTTYNPKFVNEPPYLLDIDESVPIQDHKINVTAIFVVIDQLLLKLSCDIDGITAFFLKSYLYT